MTLLYRSSTLLNSSLVDASNPDAVYPWIVLVASAFVLPSPFFPLLLLLVASPSPPPGNSTNCVEKPLSPPSSPPPLLSLDYYFQEATFFLFPFSPLAHATTYTVVEVLVARLLGVGRWVDGLGSVVVGCLVAVGGGTSTTSTVNHAKGKSDKKYPTNIAER